MQEIRIYMMLPKRSPKKCEMVGGYVLEADMTKGTVSKTHFMKLDATRNEAELTMFLAALKRVVKNDVAYSIYADFSYVESTISQGRLLKWEQNGYKNAKDQPVAHEEKWREAAILLCGKPISFHTEKHSYSKWLESELRRLNQ